MKWKLYNYIWELWHCRLRHIFDKIDKRQRWNLSMKGYSRPWWHLCCNGDGGGWRTKFCGHFDDYVHINWPEDK